MISDVLKATNTVFSVEVKYSKLKDSLSLKILNHTMKLIKSIVIKSLSGVKYFIVFFIKQKVPCRELTKQGRKTKVFAFDIKDTQI